MLPQQNRLTKVRDFNLLIKHGRWVHGQFCDAKVLTLAKFRSYFPKKEDPNKFGKQLKIAFTIGLKASKSAVKRNHVKRQMREIVRLLLKDNRLASGYCVLFVVRKEILEKNYAEISREIELLLSRAGILLK